MPWLGYTGLKLVGSYRGLLKLRRKTDRFGSGRSTEQPGQSGANARLHFTMNNGKLATRRAWTA
eukprot:11170600-Lingulodinium_polyedra.AAC.1